MGFLYVKVIEARKVAIRTSFFVNYPFVRLVLNDKEKRNTNFKPGVEWWDKILSFKLWRDISREAKLRVQIRDKSIHVFGSDWLGEITLDLKDFIDGKVHQMWYQLGKGRKSHSRAPRGYIHLAFQYYDGDSLASDFRPFAVAAEERPLTFEEWLVVQEGNDLEDHFRNIKQPEPERKLRNSSNPSDYPHLRGSNEDTSARFASSFKKVQSSPSASSDDDNDAPIPTADLIDLSFDTTPSRFAMPAPSHSSSPTNSAETSPAVPSNALSSSASSSVGSPELNQSSTDRNEKLESSKKFEKPSNPFSVGWEDMSNAIDATMPISAN